MNRVCCLVTAVMIAATFLIWGSVDAIRGDGSHVIGYENYLFDTSRVHTIEITMDGWDEFIAEASGENYKDCDIVIDGEKYSNVAIRCKGNTSLSSVATLGSTRYSFKVEFDHNDEGMTYHGLDKLSLNNLIQDATMMKDYLAYTLMNRMSVPSPLCSYVQINVNGEPWGLYLAVEGVEDSFSDRNGMTKGELYKPDSLSFGGGRGNGAGFDIEKFRVDEDGEEPDDTAVPTAGFSGMPSPGGNTGSFPGAPSGMPDMSGNGFSFSGGDGPDMSGGSFDFSGGNIPDMGSFSPGGMGDFSPGDMGDFSPGDTGGFGGFKMLGVKPQTDEDKLAACDALAAFLTSGEVQLARYNAVQWGPSNLAAQQDAAVQSNPALAALAEQLSFCPGQGQYPQAYWDLTTAFGTDINSGKYSSASDDELLAALGELESGIKAAK